MDSAVIVINVFLIGLFISFMLFWFIVSANLLFRVSLIVFFLVIIPSTYIMTIELLGKPKPITMEFFKAQEKLVVLAAKIKENEAIYIWVSIEDINKPIYFSLPYSLKTAKELQDAIRKSERNNGNVIMKNPFDNGPDAPFSFDTEPPRGRMPKSDDAPSITTEEPPISDYSRRGVI